MDELRAKILLNMVPGMSSVTMRRLINHFGSAVNILSRSVDEICLVEGVTRGLAKNIIDTKEKIDVEKEIERANKLDVKIYQITDEGYPSALRTIFDPPQVIYIRGNLLKDDIFSVAIVGTRRPTSYGRAAAQHLARQFSELGVTLVSGLARGIDTEIHRTALYYKSRTIAVLGNGLSVHYPPENRKLEDEIVASGAVISEFPLTTPPDRENFPRRNRLISALSLATVVIEADETSGALITARFAVEQGKDVFAIPGSIFSKYSRGTHKLIKEGAKLTDSAKDVIEEISNLADWVLHKGKIEKKIAELPLLTSLEQKILSLLGNYPDGLHMDKLHEVVNTSFSELSESILSLEIKGLIKSLPGKMYIRIT